MVKIKIIVVGASQVGKTMLVNFLRKSRVARYVPTIGVDLQIHTNKGVEYHIWDTSGNPAYNHVVRTFFRKSNVLVLVYNNEETFKTVQQLYDTFNILSECNDPSFYLVSTNENESSYGAAYAKDQDMMFTTVNTFKPKQVSTFWKRLIVHMEDRMLQEDWQHGQQQLLPYHGRSSYWCANWFRWNY